MTNEDLKLEAIKKAYGGYWEEMSPFVDENGWFDKNSFYKNIFSFEVYQSQDLIFTHKDDNMIPTSIAGIENNNGWIRIEEDGSNLPKEPYGLYTVLSKDPIFVEEPKNQGIEEFWVNDENKVKDWISNYSHYQPIIKPEPPIW